MILLYHRVAELNSDPWSLAVTPSHFAEHLKILRQQACPIRLQQLSQALSDGKLPDRSVVVTFDDGYADNLYNAKPLLERYGISATVFVATGYIGGEREFWWDELNRLLLQPGILPKMLHLSINGFTYRWELGKATHYSEHAAWRHRKWRALNNAPTSRHALYRSLWELLNPLSEGERRRVLNELREWASAGSVVRSTHRALAPEEVIALAQGDLVEIGAHTVTHPALSTLPLASQRDEIWSGKGRLEKILGHSVVSFAYPYGKSNHYTSETVAVVREAGFACACSNVANLVELSADSFQLPRVAVEDWNGRKFSRWISRWFHG